MHSVGLHLRAETAHGLYKHVMLLLQNRVRSILKHVGLLTAPKANMLRVQALSGNVQDNAPPLQIHVVNPQIAHIQPTRRTLLAMIDSD